MSDTEKTLQLLIEAGEQGVHSFELNQKVGTIRAAARVNDLKRRGYNISAVPELLGNARGVRYFLHGIAKEEKPVEVSRPVLVFDASRQVYCESVTPAKQSFA